ncbi:MAG TPA: hypothetical protein VHB68_04340 [Steroidobacteraceae bacterium]|nr:hypothetical protein [Steroidobacteraceae bacterium]
MRILERFTRWVKADPVIVGGFLLTLVGIPVAIFGLKDDLVRAGHEFESRARQCDRLAGDHLAGDRTLQSTLAGPAAAIQACHEALQRSIGQAGIRATTHLSGQ